MDICDRISFSFCIGLAAQNLEFPLSGFLSSLAFYRPFYCSNLQNKKKKTENHLHWFTEMRYVFARPIKGSARLCLFDKRIKLQDFCSFVVRVMFTRNISRLNKNHSNNSIQILSQHRLLQTARNVSLACMRLKRVERTPYGLSSRSSSSYEAHRFNSNSHSCDVTIGM